jgi:hypothetical protein
MKRPAEVSAGRSSSRSRPIPCHPHENRQPWQAFAKEASAAITSSARPSASYGNVDSSRDSWRNVEVRTVGSVCSLDRTPTARSSCAVQR